MAGFKTAPLVVTALTALTSWRIAFLGGATLLFAVLPATFKAQPDTAKKDIDRQGLKGLLRIRRLILRAIPQRTTNSCLRLPRAPLL